MDFSHYTKNFETPLAFHQKTTDPSDKMRYVKKLFQKPGKYDK